MLYKTVSTKHLFFAGVCLFLTYFVLTSKLYFDSRKKYNIVFVLIQVDFDNVDSKCTLVYDPCVCTRR